jgi:TonB family protein
VRTRISIALCLALGATGPLWGKSSPQDKGTCVLRPISHISKSPQPKHDGSLKGYKRSPLVAYSVDENGSVRNAKIKRASGSAAVDELALSSVRLWKFKPLPGCGTVESEALVTIDLTSQ